MHVHQRAEWFADGAEELVRCSGPAAGATIFLAGFAAAHFWLPPPAAAPAVPASLTALTQRLDALQRSVDALAVARAAATGPAIKPAALIEPAADRDVPDEARTEALSAGNAVVDRALQAARWTSEDVARLAAATASLSGEERAGIQARVSAAINQNRLEVEANAVTF